MRCMLLLLSAAAGGSSLEIAVDDDDNDHGDGDDIVAVLSTISPGAIIPSSPISAVATSTKPKL